MPDVTPDSARKIEFAPSASRKFDPWLKFALMDESDQARHIVTVDVINTTPQIVAAKYGLTGKTGRRIRCAHEPGLTREELLRLAKCGWCRRISISQRLGPATD